MILPLDLAVCLSIHLKLWYKAIYPDTTGQIPPGNCSAAVTPPPPLVLSRGVTIRSNLYLYTRNMKCHWPDCYEIYRAHLYFPEDESISILNFSPLLPSLGQSVPSLRVSCSRMSCGNKLQPAGYKVKEFSALCFCKNLFFAFWMDPLALLAVTAE